MSAELALRRAALAVEAFRARQSFEHDRITATQCDVHLTSDMNVRLPTQPDGVVKYNAKDTFEIRVGDQGVHREAAFLNRREALALRDMLDEYIASQKG